MKAYAILDVTNTDTDGDAIVVCQGDTREEAFASLAEHALNGHVYSEVRRLGALITPKERKAVTLTRIKETEVAPEPEGGKDDETNKQKEEVE